MGAEEAGCVSGVVRLRDGFSGTVIRFDEKNGEIRSPLGAGGMEEVYRGRDTRLDRPIAIKIMPAHLCQNLDARQRFERGACAISSLPTLHLMMSAARTGSTIW